MIKFEEGISKESWEMEIDKDEKMSELWRSIKMMIEMKEIGVSK